jgi:hypothetical protein
MCKVEPTPIGLIPQDRRCIILMAARKVTGGFRLLITNIFGITILRRI